MLVSYATGNRELADEGWCRSIPLETRPTAAADAIIAELEGHQTAPFMQYTWEDCVRRLLDLYETVLNKRVGINTVEALP